MNNKNTTTTKQPAKKPRSMRIKSNVKAGAASVIIRRDVPACD